MKLVVLSLLAGFVHDRKMMENSAVLCCLGEEGQRSLLGLLEVSWQVLQKSKMKLENE